MSSSATKFFSLIATSTGANYTSVDKSQFNVLFQEAIRFPRHARNLHLCVDAAEVWNVFKNVIAPNNKLYIEYKATPYILTIPEGQYTLSTLSDAIERLLVNAGAPSGTLIKLSADLPTQRVEIICGDAGVEIDFTQADTIRELLGFNSAVLTSTLAGQYFLGDNPAKFNAVNTLLIHSNIVQQGIQVNESFSQTIAQIFIDVEPGSQILFRPFNPTLISCPHLAGQLLSSISFRLSDENNVDLATNGEDWSVRIRISYDL